MMGIRLRMRGLSLIKKKKGIIKRESILYGKLLGSPGLQDQLANLVVLTNKNEITQIKCKHHLIESQVSNRS